MRGGQQTGRSPGSIPSSRGLRPPCPPESPGGSAHQPGAKAETRISDRLPASPTGQRGSRSRAGRGVESYRQSSTEANSESLPCARHSSRRWAVAGDGTGNSALPNASHPAWEEHKETSYWEACVLWRKMWWVEGVQRVGRALLYGAREGLSEEVMWEDSPHRGVPGRGERESVHQGGCPCSAGKEARVAGQGASPREERSRKGPGGAAVRVGCAKPWALPRGERSPEGVWSDG